MEGLDLDAAAGDVDRKLLSALNNGFVDDLYLNLHLHEQESYIVLLVH